MAINSNEVASRPDRADDRQECAAPERLTPSGAADLWHAALRLRLHRKPPVVFLPGLGPFGTGRTRTERMLLRLSTLGLSATFDVWMVAPRRPVPAVTSMAELAADHASAIRARFPGPVDVIGESTGGSIALRLALDHPDVVRRLVIVSAAARLGDAGRKAQRTVRRELRAHRPRRAASAMLEATTIHPGRRRLLRAAGQLLGRLVVGRSDDDLARLIDAEDRFDVGRDLQRIAAPTLLIGGACDGYYSPDLFRATADRLPHSTYLELADRGHETALASAAIRRRIREHLAAEPSSASARPGVVAPLARRCDEPIEQAQPRSRSRSTCTRAAVPASRSAGSAPSSGACETPVGLRTNSMAVGTSADSTPAS